MNEIQLDTCTKNILCVDCRDTTCLHAGKIMADCPKYKCDNDVLLDCEHCKFLKQLTKTIRRNAKDLTLENLAWSKAVKLSARCYADTEA